MFISPLMIIIALSIKLQDGGGPLFSQTRVGRGGKTFQCFKLRTMVVDAEQKLTHLLATDPEARHMWETQRKLKRDPRITRLGHFLRKSSLDELPQLWNIVRGDMSIVGPRPIIPSETVMYGGSIADYEAVRPGLTGLWQISGRSETTYDERIMLDESYVSEWSFKSDLVIVFKTIPAILMSKGAA